MSFSAQIDNDLKDAMKSGSTLKRDVLRMLKSAGKNVAIEKGGLHVQLEDSDWLAIVRKEVKKRNDSISEFEKAARVDLIEKEQAEIAVLETYLPKPLSPEEITALVAKAVEEAAAAGSQGKAAMGLVMKAAQAAAAGRVDGKTLSSEVQRQLA